MATIRYAVLRVADEWRVVCERRHIGHFGSQASAVAAGAGLAREAVSSGHEVEFMVQDAAGFLAAETFTPPGPSPSDSADPLLHARAQA